MVGVLFRKLQYCCFAGARKYLPEEISRFHSCFIGVAINEVPSFRNIPERSSISGALLYQKVLLFWIPYQIQFLQIANFPPYCSSCNSYSVILLVLTQGFPLMRSNIFKKFSLLRINRIINYFCFSNIYSIGNSFCLAAAVILKFAKSNLV